MTTISFDVPGKARGKARPRTVRTGKGGVRTYTPDPAGWCKLVTELGVKARQEAKAGITDAPVHLEIHIFYAMPKTWPQKLKDAMRGEYAVRTPDTVNVAAAVKDALERVLFQNDKQVADLLVDRVWADEHRTYIEVRYSEEVMS